MSRIAPQEHETVVGTERRAMGLARKRRIWLMRDGKCCKCGADCPVTGPSVRYDHQPPLWLGTPDEDRFVFLQCLDCDKPKTSLDQTVIAKTKRLIAKHGTGPNPPLAKPKRRIDSPGFPKHLRKRMSGKVERV